MRAWADAAVASRGVRAIRLIQGVLQLTRRVSRERCSPPSRPRTRTNNTATGPFVGSPNPRRVRSLHRASRSVPSSVP